jgi:Ca2+-binding RTX toxin-like protein
MAEAVLALLLGDFEETIRLVEPPSSLEAHSRSLSVSESIYGDKGSNSLAGTNAGHDTIDGGRGHDTIDGGAGDDVLTGGDGHDTFIFRPGFGNDIITDFTSKGGDRDVIYFSDSFFDEYDDLEASLEQVGDHVVITVSEGDHITLQNVDKLELAVHDQFIFN